MILVDTSIWIDHLHKSEAYLVALLESDEAGCHPHVIEELALGSIKGRDRVLESLGSLRAFPVLTHAELMTYVSIHRLWGRGLSAVDVNLLGSVALCAGTQLWTRDKKLLAACHDLKVSCVAEA